MLKGNPLLDGQSLDAHREEDWEREEENQPCERVIFA